MTNLACWDCAYFTEHGLGRCPRHASDEERASAERVNSERLNQLLEAEARIRAERRR